MIDAVSILALALLVLAVVASGVPGVPAGLLALAGVYVEYLFGSGGMTLWLLFSFTVVGMLAVVVDLFGGAVAARGRGASTQTSLLAGGAGLVLFFVAGPIGVVVGMFAAVFALELRREDRSVEEAWDNGLWATAGMLASGVAVFLLVASILIGYLVFVLWFGNGL
ncbi:DUF456 domain-containing protein [Halolamina salifodinae]|uniref:Uncharacterized protein YqgC (DUF456 family) n=1 Tax=Halolamina salifodinae TaxID=1202767 RepID=A0A8T4GSZ2_9EURY|nr:DUF456 domain-containing protein [Halolamina salifodinae]MBP1986147.1 uncharacterized protein YqgC (DUF456 family) [Halolamina salifodinae]